MCGISIATAFHHGGSSIVTYLKLVTDDALWRVREATDSMLMYLASTCGAYISARQCIA